MYMKRFSLRRALFSSMETHTDMLRKMMLEAKETLKRNINTLPKLVRGRARDRPCRLLLLIDAENTHVCSRSVQVFSDEWQQQSH